MSFSGTHTGSKTVSQEELAQDGDEKAGVAQIVSVSAFFRLAFPDDV